MSILLDEKRAGDLFNYRVLAILFMVMFVTGIYRNGFPALFTFLQQEFALSRAQVGLYSTFLYFSSTIVTLFCGRAVDIWGTKKSMIAGIFVLGIFLFLHSLAPSFSIILALSVLTGIGYSIITPATSKGVTQCFLEKRASFMGIVLAGLGLGGTVGAFLLPIMSNSIGWRRAVMLTSLFFLLFSLFLYFAYNNRPKERAGQNKELSKKGSFKNDLFLLLKNRSFLLIGFMGVVLGSASGITVSHFTLYLYLDYNLSATLAGIGFSILQIGSVVGRPLWGFVSDVFLKSNRKRTFFVICGLVSLFSFLFFFFHLFQPTIILVFLLSFLFGGLSRGWQGIYFATVSELTEEDLAGTAFGLSTFFIRFGITLSPPLFGYLADVRGDYSASWLVLSVITLIFALLFYRSAHLKRRRE